MKRICVLFLLLTLSLCLFACADKQPTETSQSVSAPEDENFTVTPSGTVTGYSGDSENIVLPSGARMISENFAEQTPCADKITTITLDKITSVFPETVIYSLPSLQKIIIPEGNTSFYSDESGIFATKSLSSICFLPDYSYKYGTDLLHDAYTFACKTAKDDRELSTVLVYKDARIAVDFTLVKTPLELENEEMYVLNATVSSLEVFDHCFTINMDVSGVDRFWAGIFNFAEKDGCYLLKANENDSVKVISPDDVRYIDYSDFFFNFYREDDGSISYYAFAKKYRDAIAGVAITLNSTTDRNELYRMDGHIFTSDDARILSVEKCTGVGDAFDVDKIYASESSANIPFETHCDNNKKSSNSYIFINKDGSLTMGVKARSSNDIGLSGNYFPDELPQAIVEFSLPKAYFEYDRASFPTDSTIILEGQKRTVLSHASPDNTYNEDNITFREYLYTKDAGYSFYATAAVSDKYSIELCGYSLFENAECVEAIKSAVTEMAKSARITYIPENSADASEVKIGEEVSPLFAYYTAYISALGMPLSMEAHPLSEPACVTFSLPNSWKPTLPMAVHSAFEGTGCCSYAEFADLAFGTCPDICLYQSFEGGYLSEFECFPEITGVSPSGTTTGGYSYWVTETANADYHAVSYEAYVAVTDKLIFPFTLCVDIDNTALFRTVLDSIVYSTGKTTVTERGANEYEISLPDGQRAVFTLYEKGVSLNSFAFLDVNFDRYPDLLFYKNKEGADIYYYCYQYEPTVNQYIYLPDFDMISSPVIYPNTKTIKSVYYQMPSDTRDEYSVFYHFVDGKIEKVAK